MRNRLFPIVLILLFLFGAGIFVLPQKENSVMEKRPLAMNKDIRLTSFLKDSESVLKDQFYARESITKAYYSFKSLLNKPFGSSENGGTLDGIDYVFLNDNVLQIDGSYLLNNILLYDEEKAYLTTSRAYNISEFDKTYPDIKTYVYFPTRLEEILDVGEDLNYGPSYRASFINQLNEKITWDELKIQSVEDYESFFQKSDFHWNAYGAYQGYSDIINMIRKDYDIDEPRKIFEEIAYDYEYHGNISSQVGMQGEADHITDLKLEGIGDYTYTVNGIEKDLWDTKRDYAEHGNDTQYSDFDYYFGDNAFLRIFDFHQEDKPDLLIIGDSFINVTQEWIASHFNKTVIVDLRAREDGFSLKKLIEDYDIDIALVTMYYQNLYFNGNMYIPLD